MQAATLTAVAFVLLSGCVDADLADVSFGPRAGLEVIDRGSDSGHPATKPLALVITSATTWKEFWDLHTAGQQPRPAAPEVDWSTSAVLALVHGRAPTGGHSIYVESALAGEDGYRVTYKLRHPGAGCAVSQAQTNPYYLALISAEAARDVVWNRVETKAADC